MKTERAIELLNRISDSQFDGIHGDERREALEMAVRALEQNLVQEPDGLVKDLVKDCISRQAAIDAVNEWLKLYVINRTMSNVTSIQDILRQLPSAQPATDNDLVGRGAVKKWLERWDGYIDMDIIKRMQYRVIDIPSAQPKRDIPVKPIETTDKAWGIPKRQAVCPKCDYYLGHVAFLGDYKGKRVTYCETCGQAIDWEGWNFDE